MELWQNIYSKDTSSILVGKSKKNSTEMIAALALLAPCTTREAAKFVLTISPDNPERPKVHDRQARILEQTYNRLIIGRHERSLGKARTRKKHDSIINTGYVRSVGKKINEKKKRVTIYFLTLKGCLFSLGYKFTDKELEKFIKNASRVSLCFSYINAILEKTNVTFIRRIFIEPFQNLIKQDLVHLDGKTTLYFDTIANAVGSNLYEIFSKLVKSQPKLDRAVKFRILINNTFFDSKNFLDWQERMKNYFYSNEDDFDFYFHYSEDSDLVLLYKIMRVVHFAYYEAMGFGIPVKHQNKDPPLPKNLIEHRRYKQKVQNINKRVRDELTKRGIKNPTIQDEKKVRKEMDLEYPKYRSTG